MKQIYLAAGCFWGAEHYLQLINGVVSTRTGFANGNTEDPTYKEVYTDTTGYAETVKVEYDPEILSLETLVNLYFYYTDPEDLPAIKKVYDEIAAEYGRPLAVELEPLRNFYSAEEYHQDYLNKNPQGYCHLPQALFDFARKANR